MSNLKTDTRILFYLLCALFSTVARADQVRNAQELKLLPAYCQGTQQVRAISQDPRSVEEYIGIYGEAFRHLHHFCWALNAENNALRMRDQYLKTSKLNNALSDYKYFLDRAPDTFPLLPEVYINRSRVLFTLKRDGEGVADLKKAIQLMPEHYLAYARLADYQVRQDDKDNAIKTLIQGIDHTENAAPLIKRLERLGKTYEGVPGHASKKPASVESQASNTDTPKTTPDNPPPTTTVEPLDTRTEVEKKANPYCRFCP